MFYIIADSESSSSSSLEVESNTDCEPVLPTEHNDPSLECTEVESLSPDSGPLYPSNVSPSLDSTSESCIGK